MPHKHKRKAKDDEHFDLAPSKRAKPLPVGKGAAIASEIAKNAKKRRRDKGAEDDTPKAFARLMAFASGKKIGPNLDNGDAPAKSNKKRKLGQDALATQPKQPELPKIMPGERLGDFAARVDQALPVAGLARKGAKVEGVKERRTRLEKKITRMQDEWRKDEERLREKEEEERELAEEAEEDRAAEYGKEYRETMLQKSKKGKKGKMIGEQADDGDPWAVLKAKREAPKGLHDVAQAPPQFKAVPKEKFKIRNGAKVQVTDIPNAAGSLRRREELGQERKNIIESYRRLMDSKRAVH